MVLSYKIKYFLGFRRIQENKSLKTYWKKRDINQLILEIVNQGI